MSSKQPLSKWFNKYRESMIGERQEAQILKFNAPPLHT